jgi:CheY-like chemotaxis protein
MGLTARKVVLEELGHRVTTANGPLQAQTILAERKYDLVITDFRMPDMNGAELIQWMRGQSMTCPIILISGFVDALGLNEDNTGADVVIQKSSHEVSHLLRAVKNLLRPRKPNTSQLPPKPSRARKSSL